ARTDPGDAEAELGLERRGKRAEPRLDRFAEGETAITLAELDQAGGEIDVAERLLGGRKPVAQSLEDLRGTLGMLGEQPGAGGEEIGLDGEVTVGACAFGLRRGPEVIAEERADLRPAQPVGRARVVRQPRGRRRARVAELG